MSAVPDRLPRTPRVPLRALPPAAPGAPPPDRARVRRMRVELVAALRTLVSVERCVAVFGSARTPTDDPEYALAHDAALRLGRAGFAIMTGGGPGTMEAANRGAQAAGALSIGCHIDLPSRELCNDHLDIALRFTDLFTRKAIFVRFASAYLVFPGGFGTLDELFEVLLLMQTGKISPRPLILVGDDYFAGLVDWLRERVAAEGRIGPGDLDLLHVAPDAAALDLLLDALAAGLEPPGEKSVTGA